MTPRFIFRGNVFNYLTHIALLVLLLVAAVKFSHEFSKLLQNTTKESPIQHAITNDHDPLHFILQGHLTRIKLLEADIEPILPGPVPIDGEMDIQTIKGHIESNNVTFFQEYYDNIGEWKFKLFSRLDNIRLHCGKLCQLNTVEDIRKYQSPKLPDGGVLPLITVPDVDCDVILSLEDIDAADMTFPRTIPDELWKYYSLNGIVGIRIDKYIRKDAYLEGSAEKKLWKTGNVWNEIDINEAVEQAANHTLKGPYGVVETTDLTKTLEQVDMKGKSILVIGSSHPWVEAICLYHGAAKVTTLEYGEIISNHPQIVTETPSSIRQKYVNGELELFDGIVTHSSVEHSGLGRYGDALNPWGDILAIARAWCIAKPKAFMWAAVPTGDDRVFYNWHRIYGYTRWPLLVSNWRQFGKDVAFTDEQAVMHRGVIKSMKNIGFLFEKVEPNEKKV